MTVFRNIVAAYKNRSASNDFASWAKGNPDEADMLARAEILAKKVKDA